MSSLATGGECRGHIDVGTTSAESAVPVVDTNHDVDAHVAQADVSLATARSRQFGTASDATARMRAPRTLRSFAARGNARGAQMT